MRKTSLTAFAVAAALLFGGLAAGGRKAEAQSLGGGDVVISGADLSGHWDFKMDVLVKSDPSIADTFTGSFDVTGGVPTYSGSGFFNGREATISGSGAVDPTTPTTITLSDHIATTDSETHFTVTLMSGDLGTGTFFGGTLDRLQKWSGVFDIKITRTPTQTPAQQIESAFAVALSEMRKTESMAVEGLFATADAASDELNVSLSKAEIGAIRDRALAAIELQRRVAVRKLGAISAGVRDSVQAIILAAPAAERPSLRRLSAAFYGKIGRSLGGGQETINADAGYLQVFLRRFAKVYVKLETAETRREALKWFLEEHELSVSEQETRKTEAEKQFEKDVDAWDVPKDVKDATKESMRKMMQIRDEEIRQLAEQDEHDLRGDDLLDRTEVEERIKKMRSDVKSIVDKAIEHFKHRLEKACALSALITNLGISIEVGYEAVVVAGLEIKPKCSFTVKDRPSDYPIESKVTFRIDLALFNKRGEQYWAGGGRLSSQEAEGGEAEGHITLNEDEAAAINGGEVGSTLVVKITADLKAECVIHTKDFDQQKIQAEFLVASNPDGPGRIVIMQGEAVTFHTDPK